MATFGPLAGEKYISLESYRRSGAGVRTPVWFAADPGATELYVFTTASAGKTKRIRRNRAVRIAPCDARGRVTGAWLDATAEIMDGPAAARAMRLLGRKYFPVKQALDLVSGLTGRLRQRVTFVIRAA